MKKIKNLKMNKQVAFRGKVMRMLTPKNSHKLFKFENLVLDRFVKGTNIKGIKKTEKFFVSENGEKRRICVYTRAEDFYRYAKDGNCKADQNQDALQTKNLQSNVKKPAVLWIHGGGYAIGVPEQVFPFIKRMLFSVDCVVAVPEYTRSTQKPYPHGFNDCYNALLWLKENCAAFGASNEKIFVGGESAGGGYCAALCLYARDKGEVNIAFQMPIYPMLDDRPTQTNQNNHAPCWDSRLNDDAWRLYLGELYNTDNVPCYAAPARATNYSNLPPAVTYVGDIEPFTAETITYVNNLQSAGIKVSFKMFKGCYHGFDIVCSDSDVGREAAEFFKENFVFAAKNYSAKQPEK